LRFETPNKDFWVTLGTRFQYDAVWFREDKNLSHSNIGSLQDDGSNYAGRAFQQQQNRSLAIE